MRKSWNSQTGIGLPELLVVVAIMGIALGAAALYLKPAEAPLQLAAELLEGYFRQARGLQRIAGLPVDGLSVQRLPQASFEVFVVTHVGLPVIRRPAGCAAG